MAPKPQFSLRLLFVATAVIAFFTAMAAVFPKRLAALLVFGMTSLLLTAVGAGAIYARSSKRSFFVGALLSWLTFPALTGSFPLAGPRPAFLGGSIVDIYGLWLLAFVGGFTAVVVRRLVIDDSAGEPR